MTGPPNRGQPWWARPGGAPIPGQPPAYPPQPTYPPQPAWQPPPPQQQAPWTGGPPAAPPPSPPPQQNRTIVWAALAFVGVVAVTLVGILWATGTFSKKVLDVRQAEAGVQQVLSDPINGYGANDVTSVECNNGDNPTIKKGNSFTCAVELNGVTRNVTVVFRDDAGNYEVDGPR